LYYLLGAFFISFPEELEQLLAQSIAEYVTKLETLK